jgi:glycopeptide antibiotics resistance protein
MLDGYRTLFAVCIALAAGLYLPAAFPLKKRGKGFTRQASYALCFLSLFLIVFTTLVLFNLPFRFAPPRRILNLQPFRWLREGDIARRITTEICPNAALFIPLGLSAPLAFARMRKFYATASAAALVTVSVEFFQYFIGRSSDVDDVLANLSGALVGYAVFKILGYFFRNRTRWRRLLGTEA